MAADWFQMIRRDGDKAIVELRALRDVNIRGSDGESLLHSAIAYASPDTALYLISRGIDVNAKDFKGKTPLHYACDHHDPGLAEIILEHGGAIDAEDEHGNTPLWSAVFNARGNYEVVSVLIRHGAVEFASHKNKRP